MDPFLGEIRLMPYSYAPRGWALCQGQTLSIAQNSALFALLGTMYGGDGRTNFMLPNLQGRTYVGQGQGQGLTNYAQGSAVGTESVTLSLDQMPSHGHTLSSLTLPVNTSSAGQGSPQGNYYAQVNDSTPYGFDGTTQMAGDIVSGTATTVGGSQAHENRMPLLVLNYCIATQGIFPQRP